MHECTTICGVEIDPVQSAPQRTIPGVFPALVNRAAFLDKVTFRQSMATPLKRFPKTIHKTANFAIGGPGRPYARSLHGIHVPLGQSRFELKYGPNPRFRNLYAAKLILRSEAAPLCHDEAVEIVDALFRAGKPDRSTRG